MDIQSIINEHKIITYYQKLIMINKLMIELGYSGDVFDVTSLPKNKPEQIFNYTPNAKDAIFFVAPSDSLSQELLKEYGYSTEILQLSATDEKLDEELIKNCIREGKPWKQYVPHAVYEYITKNGLDERIRGNDTQAE